MNSEIRAKAAQKAARHTNSSLQLKPICRTFFLFLLILTSTSARAEVPACLAATYQDGLQTHGFRGKIEFDDQAQLLGNPDNILGTHELKLKGHKKKKSKKDKYPESNSCGNVECLASGVPVTPQQLPEFIKSESKQKFKIDKKHGGVLGADGTRSFRDVHVKSRQTLDIAVPEGDSGAVYVINHLKIDRQSTINLRAGEYWIHKLSIHKEGKIQVVGSGTAHLYVQKKFKLETKTGLNSTGNAAKLVLIGYEDIHLKSAQVNAIIYGKKKVKVDRDSVVRGAIAAGKIELRDKSQVYYQEPTASACLFDSDDDGIDDKYDLCPATPIDETADTSGCSASQRDTDDDGVNDAEDLCPTTPTNESPDTTGCSASQRDTDSDGVADSDDVCPLTPIGESPDAVGCSASQRDADSDGVADSIDQCPESIPGEPVDETGCPLGPIDTDGDGVFDDFDSCPNSSPGEPVYADGCSVTELDSDGDGVADSIDICPDTSASIFVDFNGCGAADNPIIPAHPEQVATPIGTTTAATVFETTTFLYEGNDPIQTGVFENTIEPEQAAVTRGQVQNRFGDPVAGVTVHVAGKPEFGETRSRSDGQFDMAVNGGGALTLVFEKSGYLPVHRRVQVPWQDYAVLPEVVMTPLDSKVTMIEPDSSEMQVAQGSVVTDEDGERQSTLMFSAGITAAIVMPDGSEQPISQLSIRATEFTVGDTGPQAMPAELPPYTAYTYAVELSVDEAIAEGANTVRFNKPVSYYVDNFLDFPVGGAAPVGYYDRDKMAWIPSDDGRVIGLIGIDSNGLAELDVDGSGIAADANALSELEFTSEELNQIAEMREPGTSFWRIRVSHFTPYDINWPAATNAANTVEQNTLSLNLNDTKSESSLSQTNPNCRGGSIIECQNQVLRERIFLTGTDLALNYRSDRVPGRTANNALDIPLTGDQVPADLKQIEVTVTVAGRVFEQTYDPFPNQTHKFFWDGKDVYGRDVQGQLTARIAIGYVYDSLYQIPVLSDSILQSFGIPAGTQFAIRPARQETVFTETRESLIGVLDAQVHGLGGWTLDVHHTYDPIGHTVYLGTGERRSLQGTDSRVRSYGRLSGFSVDEPFVIDPNTGFDRYIMNPDFGPDGSLYYIAQDSLRIRRLTKENVVSTVAGSGPTSRNRLNGGFEGDGGPATEALLNYPTDVAVGNDGSLYIADSFNHRIRRVSPDGIITTFAGSGPIGSTDCCISDYFTALFPDYFVALAT